MTNIRGIAAAAGAAMLAAGFLMTPVTVHAYPELPLAPACKDFTFSGDFALKQSNRYRVEFPTTGHADVGTRATATGDDGSKMYGHVSGGVTGRHVDFTIEWDTGPRGHYTGDIDESGFVHGFAVDEANPGSRASWDSTVPFKCVAQAGLGTQLNGTFKVSIAGGPSVTWVITSMCSSADSCAAQVHQTEGGAKWIANAQLRENRPDEGLGNAKWHMVVDRPDGVNCPEKGYAPAQYEYTWNQFTDNYGSPIATSSGWLNIRWSSTICEPGFRQNDFTMTKVG